MTAEKGRRCSVLIVNPNTGKVSLNGGTEVRLKGCISSKEFNKIREEQQKEDQRNPPPPAPTDRDGYFVCHPDTQTWHFCTTYPPYSCDDWGIPC